MSELPRLTVIVVIVTGIGQPYDGRHLSACLKALVEQIDPPPMEILVPFHHGLNAIEPLRRWFPQVTFLSLPVNTSVPGSSGEPHNELRARGLAAARGELVAFVDDFGLPAPDWCRRIADSYPGEYAGVGGAIENIVDRPLNWAVFFSDFAEYQNPLPAGPAKYVTDANVSYRRSALEAIRPVWEAFFVEPLVNQALLERGEKLGLSPETVVYHQRHGLSLRNAIRERYNWGRSYAAYRTQHMGLLKRAILLGANPLLPLFILLRTCLTVLRKGRSQAVLIKALPALALLSIGWSLGELAGLLTGRSSRQRPIPGTPKLTPHP